MNHSSMIAVAALVVNCFASVTAQDLAPTNPVWKPAFHVRDPAVVRTGNGYEVFFSRYKFGNWAEPKNWTIGRCTTTDFITWQDHGDISPAGHASPARPVVWHGRTILAYQRYPAKPVELVYSASTDGTTWTAPVSFLTETNQLAWNTRHRTIDPTLIVDGDRLVCLFVGTTDRGIQVNLVGVATTTDPDLKQWTIVSQEAPLIGPEPDALDGAENIDVVRDNDHWLMIYSRGLRNQHLAYAVSTDLLHWEFKGPIAMTKQWWMERRYGAPSIWKEPDGWRMLLMGEDTQAIARVGLLRSDDGIAWSLLPAEPKPTEIKP